MEGEVYFQRSEQLRPGPGASAGPAPANGSFKAIGRNRDGNYVLRGLTVYPVSGPLVSNAVVVIQKGKIAAVLDATKDEKVQLPANATVVEAAGLHLYPGMIDAATVLGLTELGSPAKPTTLPKGAISSPTCARAWPSIPIRN